MSSQDSTPKGIEGWGRSLRHPQSSVRMQTGQVGALFVGMESPTNSSPPAMAAASPWLLRIADLANLTTAWEKVRHNGGAPGVDGINVAAFERVVSKELPILKKALIEGSYQPRPVRAVDIPKPSGGLRTLGIPTVADRVVQQAISQVLTPVWDVLFSPSSHAYRRGHEG